MKNKRIDLLFESDKKRTIRDVKTR